MKQLTKNKIFSLIVTLFLSILIIFSGVCPTYVRADDSAFKFDETNVLDDLESSKEFNLNDYYWDKTGLFKQAQIINFVEWCYSPFKTDDFALYIYFYNPQNIKIDVDSPSNKIQIASKYDTTPINRDSLPTQYDRYSLIFCNKSTKSGYEGMFYKFKVVDDKGSSGTYLKDRIYSNERRYDVSGVVLASEDGKEKEYLVGGTYYFTGYAKGYGPDETAESTLECIEFRVLETIECEVHPTKYRQVGTSSKGDGHKWEIDSVYFSVPNKFFDKYGNLQKIKAEWHEYQTEYMFIARKPETRDALSRYVDVKIPAGTRQDSIPGYVQNWNGGEPLANGYGLYYNLNPTFLGPYSGSIIEEMKWLTYSESGEVSKDQIINDITKQTNNTEGFLPVTVEGKNISSKFFRNELFDGRENVSFVGDDIHHKNVEIDANAKFDLFGYEEENITLAGNLFRAIFGWNKEVEEILDVSPIIYDRENNMVIENALSLSSPTSVAKTLLIDEEDVSSFKSFYEIERARERTTVLFRFATTDYFYTKMHTVGTSGNATILPDNDLSIAYETMFFDFKVIHLSFVDPNGVYAVIPVVHNPIDIINDITKEPDDNNDGFDFLRLLLIVVLLILLIPLLSLLGILPLIGNVIIFIITAPFKFIKWLVNKFRGG